MDDYRRGSTERILFRAFTASALNMTVQFGYNILLVPVLLTLWGVDKFGVWLAVVSIFSLLMALDIGHSTYVGNEFNRHFQSDRAKARFILASSLKAQYVSGAIQIIILASLMLTGLIHRLFDDTPHLNSALIGLGIFVLYRFVIGSARGIVIRVVYPIGYMDRMTYLYTIERCLEIGLLVVMALMDWSIAIAAMSVVLLRTLYSFVIFKKVRHWMPHIFPWWESGSWKTGLRNYFNGLSLAFSTFVDKFNADGLNIVITAVLGVVVLPIFATIRTIGNTALQGVQLIAEPLQPELMRYHASRQFDKLRETLKTNWLINGLAVSVGFALSVYIVEPLYLLWTNNKLPFDQELYLLIVTSVLMITFGRTLMIYLRSINALRAIVLIAVIRVVTVLGLSLILIRAYQLIGVGIAIVLGEFLSSYVLPIVIVRRVFRAFREHLYSGIIAISSLPYFVAAVFIWLQMYFGIKAVWLPVSTVILFALTGYAQWVILSGEVKRRLRSLIPV